MRLLSVLVIVTYSVTAMAQWNWVAPRATDRMFLSLILTYPGVFSLFIHLLSVLESSLINTRSLPMPYTQLPR